MAAVLIAASTLVLAIMTSVRARVSRATPVSLVALLANPGKYHGKVVQVSGYLHKKFEDSALYLSKSDGDYLLTRNALWVRYSKGVRWSALHKVATTQHFDCKYVLVEGIVDGRDHGHKGLFLGAIKQVTRVVELARRYNGKKRGE